MTVGDLDPLATARDHTWAESVMTDWINGRMAAESSTRMRQHLSRCAVCRADALIEEQVHAELAQQPVVEYAPQSSFRRLMDRIHSEQESLGESEATPTPERAVGPPGHRTVRRRRRRIGLAASAVAVTLVFGVWLRLALVSEQPKYQTLTSAPAVSEGRLQIVFADDATASEIRSALGAVRGHIVDGPGFSGLFLVAIEGAPGSQAPHPADWTQAEQQLTRNSAVRFVTLVDAGAGS